MELTEKRYETYRNNVVLYYSGKAEDAAAVKQNFQDTQLLYNGKMGQIDCDQFKEICAGANLNGIPAISIMINEQIFFVNPRMDGKKIAIELKELSKPVLQQFYSLKQLQAAAEKAGAKQYMIFSGYEYDHYEPLTLKLRGKIFCGYLFSDSQRIYIVQNGQEITFKGEMTEQAIIDFIQKNKKEL